MLRDRWNPRLWLRDWLNRKSPAERAAHEADIAKIVAQLEAGAAATAFLSRQMKEGLEAAQGEAKIASLLASSAMDVLQPGGLCEGFPEDGLMPAPERGLVDPTSAPPLPPQPSSAPGTQRGEAP